MDAIDFPSRLTRLQSRTAVYSFSPGCWIGYAHHCSKNFLARVSFMNRKSISHLHGPMSPRRGVTPHPFHVFHASPSMTLGFPGSYASLESSALCSHSIQRGASGAFSSAMRSFLPLPLITCCM